MLITSTENKKIKEIVKLKQKKYRNLRNKFIVETENLIEEAYLENALEEVYILENEKISFEIDCPIFEVTQKVMDKIKNINTSKVLGIAKKQNNIEYIGNKYLMLDRISDPGNLGTIIRSSAAFDIDTLILSENCCDPYNEKTIRASEGAIFKVNIIIENLEEALTNLKKMNINIYTTDVTSGKSITEIPKNNYCIIMGNESSGVSDKIKNQINNKVHIKTNNVESLNVAVATSIILYELNKK